MPVLYEVQADKELQEIIIQKEAEFWTLVETKTPPEPVNYSDMVARFKRSTALEVVASEPVLYALNALKKIREEIKKYEEDEEYCKAVIMGELKDGDTLVDLEGNALVTWKQAKATKRFDAKAFQADQPELYAQYVKESEASRRFIIK
jgi:predicted phage-related endonuclease